MLKTLSVSMILMALSASAFAASVSSENVSDCPFAHKPVSQGATPPGPFNTANGAYTANTPAQTTTTTTNGSDRHTN